MEQKHFRLSQEDMPVTMGLVIDNSGSMRDKRPQVNAAALDLRARPAIPQTKSSSSISTTSIIWILDARFHQRMRRN